MTLSGENVCYWSYSRLGINERDAFGAISVELRASRESVYLLQENCKQTMTESANSLMRIIQKLTREKSINFNENRPIVSVPYT